MKSVHHDPSVILPEGFAIGYRKKLLSSGPKDILLATSENEIKLTPGRHLLLARNGRGKTTLLKTIAGILAPLSGTISREGSVQYLDEDLRFDNEMKPRQIFSALFKNGNRSFAMEMAERIELDPEKPYGKLSKGNRQKVGLIVAETHARAGGPQILLLDEPFSGLDFAARDFVDEIWSEKENDMIRLVCVHPDEPTLKADSAVLIRDGKLEQVDVDGTLDWMETKEALN
ncbi:MAG: ATP-binding cassette domain-containing protein [Verrucomicrobiales bacterium]|nr:ATP-binding cassette domain-containing protein [Verrucomicrobiales bacterium]